MISGRCSLLSAIRYASRFAKYSGNNNVNAGVICFDSFESASTQQIGRLHQNTFSTSGSAMASTSHDGGQKHPPKQNKLAGEKSPYLLQHASNPVEWYPWGEEAFMKARREDKLIFLSIGYSTCHWCHVMERESFENPEIAKIMNRYYVNIKVDKEERPDVDRVYTEYIEAMKGNMGWPMSVFLAPDLKPITGGTYFPPTDRDGHLGFDTILIKVAHKWLESKQDMLKYGTKFLKALEHTAKARSSSSATEVPAISCWKLGAEQLEGRYDEEFGGFTGSRKFPSPLIFSFLFHIYARDPKSEEVKNYLEMCLHTLRKMADGGIHDHVGQGFARYAVDEKWHVPHFEKMLYDQGLLLRAYTDAYLATKDPSYAEVVDDIATYVTRDLRHKDGGFYSAEDADSLPTADSKSKREGAFYVWTYDEIKTHLNKEIDREKKLRLSDVFSYHFDVRKDGNVDKFQDPHGELTDQNVLIVFGSCEKTADHFDCKTEDVQKYLSEALKILFEARASRPRPHRDDKIITAWNGIMISGLARAGAAVKNAKYIEYAESAAKFVERYLYDKEKKILLRSCYPDENNVITQLRLPIQGFHGDYANFVRGLLDLYEATLNDHWLEFAEQLQDIQDELFWDPENGGYFTTTGRDRSVIIRLKEDFEGAEPSSNSVACGNLLRLSACLDRPDYKEKATKLFVAFHKVITTVPAVVPELMSALLQYHDSTTQIFIVGKKDSEDTNKMADVVRGLLLPGRALLLVDPGNPDSIVFRKNRLTNEMTALEGRATAYVCRRHTCSLPVSDPLRLEDLLRPGV